MNGLTMQIGGKTVTSPWGLEVIWNKSLFTDDGDTTRRFYDSKELRDDAWDYLQGNPRVKSKRKI